MIKLSKRLKAIVDEIPYGAAVIDVGTDHGLIPVFLALNSRASAVAASDIHPDPLQKAVILAEEKEVSDKIRFSVCDGLAAFTSADADCVVIAGMGGEVMVHILSEAPWTRDNTILILQPQTKADALRFWLTQNGYRILREKLVEDAGRIYPVLVSCGGKSLPYSEIECLLGTWSQISSDPLLPNYLERMISRYKKSAPFDSKDQMLYNSLVEWKERL